MKNLFCLVLVVVSLMGISNAHAAQTSFFDINATIQLDIKAKLASNVNTKAITDNYAKPGCSVRHDFTLVDNAIGTASAHKTFLYVIQGACSEHNVESVTWKVEYSDSYDGRGYQYERAFVLYVQDIKYGECTR